MGVPSGMELFVIVAVIVLLFGGKKIPELAKGLGQGIKNFKGALKEDDVNVATTNSDKVDTTKINATDAKPEQTAVNSTETKAV